MEAHNSDLTTSIVYRSTIICLVTFPFGGECQHTLLSSFIRQTNLNYLPAVKITGANCDSSFVDTIHPQQQLNEVVVQEQEQTLLFEIPKSDSTVMSKSSGEGGEIVGCALASSSSEDVIQDEGAVQSSSESTSTTTQGGSNDDVEVWHEVTSIELSASDATTSSSSEDDTTDDEDFLDLLANTLDDEFDLDLMF